MKSKVAEMNRTRLGRSARCAEKLNERAATWQGCSPIRASAIERTKQRTRHPKKSLLKPPIQAIFPLTAGQLGNVGMNFLPCAASSVQ